MNKKLLFLFLLPSLALANPKSIHWSALGNYLVDQDGHRTHIDGHPWLRCYKGQGVLEGWYQSARGSTILLQTKLYTILVDYPDCDVFEDHKKESLFPGGTN